MNALRNLADPDVEVRKAEYDKSLISGVLPYDVIIDSDPVPHRAPATPRHAYITWSRLLEKGFTKLCQGCDKGTTRHNAECRAKFDAAYRDAPKTPTVGPASSDAPRTPAVEPALHEAPRSPAPEPASSSRPAAGPPEPMLEDSEEARIERLVNMFEYSPDDLPGLVASLFGMVTRQLSRSEVLSRPDALEAIRKEFQGIGDMGTWNLDTVREEGRVRAEALREGIVIHIGDLLAICSERNMELDPLYRKLKGRVCFRGDNAKTADGRLALYQTMAATPTSITAANAAIAYGLMEGNTISTADAVKAYLQSELASLAITWVRLPKEVWPAHWHGLYKRPLIQLRRSLYGHPQAGAHWERHLEQQLKEMGGTKVSEFASTFIFPNYGQLLLTI